MIIWAGFFVDESLLESATFDVTSAEASDIANTASLVVKNMKKNGQKESFAGGRSVFNFYGGEGNQNRTRGKKNKSRKKKKKRNGK